MAVTHATLAQEVDGKVEYIYPKTVASIVEYDENDSVKTKIEKIDKNIGGINDRITNILKYGDLGEANFEELVDARIPNYNLVPEDTTYETVGDAIRGQLEEIVKLFNNVALDIEYIKKYLGNWVSEEDIDSIF